MTETLLTMADQKERLSLVYVNAVAARAGFVTSVPELDRDSVDLHIRAGGRRRPSLDLQLKASAALGHLLPAPCGSDSQTLTEEDVMSTVRAAARQSFSVSDVD